MEKKETVLNNKIGGKFDECFGLFASGAIVDELHGAQAVTSLKERQAEPEPTPTVGADADNVH
jgi:hypothetical protein